MGRRRRRKPPHHRQGRQPPQKMLDMGRRTRFKYKLKAVLERSDMDDDYINSFYTTVYSKGSKGTIEDAKEWVDEKWDEELFGEEVRNQIHALLDKYSTYR